MTAGRAVRALVRAAGLFQVVFADQRLGVDTDRARDRADVPSDVQVTAAGLVVVLLDAADDRVTDPGALTKLIDRQTRTVTGLSQRFANSHEASTYRPGLITM